MLCIMLDPRYKKLKPVVQLMGHIIARILEDNYDVLVLVPFMVKGRNFLYLDEEQAYPMEDSAMEDDLFSSVQPSLDALLERVASKVGGRTTRANF